MTERKGFEPRVTVVWPATQCRSQRVSVLVFHKWSFSKFRRILSSISSWECRKSEPGGWWQIRKRPPLAGLSNRCAPHCLAEDGGFEPPELNPLKFLQGTTLPRRHHLGARSVRGLSSELWIGKTRSPSIDLRSAPRKWPGADHIRH